MKIKNIQLKDHPILKNLKADFCNEKGEVQNLIVIAGSNGSGKTNLLEAIYDYFKEKSELKETCNSEMELLDEKLDYPNKIIYLPTEINFSNVQMANDKYRYDYKFLNRVDSNMVNDIPSYLATKVKLMQKANEDMSYKEIKERVSEETNKIFEALELDVKMIGFTSDEKDLPLFTNSYGEEFDINKLSSGEKQLFIRALTLKMVEAENAIILIDEPEISLHPKWQQKIVKVYENIGKNNQVIIATHSPHILGSVSNENIRVMRKTAKGIEIKTYDELTYGQSIETILEDVMELENVITPEIADKFKKLHEMILNGEYETENFKSLHQELGKVLGPHNEELLLLNLQLSVVKGKRGN
ncbi:MAG: AAA family ATPase [Cetobacterium sp.]|uniref:AAA family ATPase n=1 Tax=Cetobacterium sp. TaxID=2071632 RepID=UPI002FC8BBBE